jgi:hypothetical protein
MEIYLIKIHFNIIFIIRLCSHFSGQVHFRHLVFGYVSHCLSNEWLQSVRNNTSLVKMIVMKSLKFMNMITGSEYWSDSRTGMRRYTLRLGAAEEKRP